MNQGDVASRRLHVSLPVRVLSQHGHEVALTVNDGHDERQADDTTGPPARHLESDQIVWTDSARRECCGASVEDACHPIGTPTSVKPSAQIHLCPPIPTKTSPTRSHPTLFTHLPVRGLLGNSFSETRILSNRTGAKGCFHVPLNETATTTSCGGASLFTGSGA